VKLAERILIALYRSPNASDYEGGTLKTDRKNALHFLCKTTPGFLDMIRGKRVLDYACGWGWQADAMSDNGAKHVVVFDINLTKALERKHPSNVEFLCSLEGQAPFDLTVCCSSIEHFSDPKGDLPPTTVPIL
jgi:2-polyprenyl-3-methyl-5-hydroxy-6-metoxy-1,4-benzoquinol methylase